MGRAHANTRRLVRSSDCKIIAPVAAAQGAAVTSGYITRPTCGHRAAGLIQWGATVGLTCDR